MSKPISRVGVIGAGVMGSGIAAHLTNAGRQVLLLDIVPPNLKDPKNASRAERDAFAAGGLEKALKAKPAAFFHKSGAELVRVGNVEDDLDQLAECDLVIEAVLEKIEVKQALFEKLDKIVGEGTLVASNTSGLRIAEMTKGRSQGFRERFLVMHFFNPVRYMKLLEIVAGPDTRAEVIDRARRFSEDVLGKGVVVGKDTPNFVGNRIGCYSMLAGIHQMLEDGLAPEDVDAITGLPMAHPKSASFRTADMVGVDTFLHVADNCYAALTEDEERDVFKAPEFIRKMVEKKLLGNKTKAGFYRKTAAGIETFDPKTLEYRVKAGDQDIRKRCKGIGKVEDPAERLRKMVADDGPAGQYAWRVLSKSLAYAARRVGEITDDLAAIDEAMRWGYNWQLGPFQCWDALGVADTTARMRKDGLKLPDSIAKMQKSGAKNFYRKDGAVFDLAKGDYVPRPADPRNATLTVLRSGEAALLTNDGAEAWDIGDGVLSVTFKTKANSVDPDVIKMLGEATDLAERDFRALLITNEGDHFCVGANLFLVVMAANQKNWEGIRLMSQNFQMANQRLKYASVPVVSAPYGMALGGGLELCLASDAVQAAAETYAGLVEVGVGLLPGGAGGLNLLWRALDGLPEGVQVPPIAIVGQVFQNIALAKVATSAEEAKHFGYFYKSDGVSFDRARLLAEAKARAIGLAAAGYHPPTPRKFRLPGESGIATLRMMVDSMVAGGFASEHDAKVATKVAEVLCGGVGGAGREITEDAFLEIEADAFVSLCGEPKSLERMQYMLMKNKPLRN